MIKLEFLKVILEWINTPWRLVGFIITTLILGGAYTVYEYRDSIIQSYISKGVVAMDTTRIPEAVSFLKEREEVNAVYIWSVDLESNRRWLVDSTSKMPDVTSYQLFTDSVQQVQIIVKLLDAQISCSVITDDNIVLNIYKQTGNYICAVAVPPYMGKFLGIIVVTMDEQPNESVKKELMSRLKLSSAILTKA